MAASPSLARPRLAVFGATGPTGICAVKRALELGHNVTTLVRSPEKLKDIQNENLKVVKANIFEPDSLVEHLNGQNAVMSYLGAHNTSALNPTTLYSESMKSIMIAMERAKVNRVVTITSWCTVKQPGNPKLMEWFLKPLFLNGFLRDMHLMENMLEESSFNYTFIRPPGLSNAKAKNNYKLAEGQYLDGVSWTISREDVADASLKVLQTSDWDRKGLAIGCLK
ncbi:flavin reductase (NADPH)-like [Actinia tenebrosa]|uniref:Flavin reductase (NADPH)-like n=1 Tax=Actinia tenebrosa TaxID=6105 RepID=A0A6P8HTJ4_ACTTE|nr:flavin reductase (NADPH)-like [Actinia tenebrosa]XP_031559714.1 flavin reductase (NADPH)-like [Actinia tenebrosa]